MKISEKGRGKGRLSAMLARAKQLGSGFSPGLFRLFSPDAKHPAWRPLAAVPESDMSAETFDVRPLRNSGNQAFSPHHVNSAIAGPGDHPLVGVWGGQPQRNPFQNKFQFVRPFRFGDISRINRILCCID